MGDNKPFQIVLAEYFLWFAIGSNHELGIDGVWGDELQRQIAERMQRVNQNAGVVTADR